VAILISDFACLNVSPVRCQTTGVGTFDDFGVRALALVLGAVLVAVSANGGVEFCVTFYATLYVAYLVARRPPRPLPPIPDGIVGPRDRAVHVELQGQAYYVRVGISVRDAAAFSLERANYASRLEAFLAKRPRVETGDALFDAAFHLEGRRLEPEARAALAEIFEHFSAYRVRSDGGRLMASVPLSRVRWRTDYEILLRLLDTAARAIERVALEVRVLGGERRALVGHGTPRCAYCHEDVTGLEPDLVACATCSTVLHEGCWGELGRCPVLGCRSVSVERASSVAQGTRILT